VPGMKSTLADIDHSLNISGSLVFLGVLTVLLGVPMGLLWHVTASAFSIALIPLGSILLFSTLKLAGFAQSREQRLVAMTFWVFVYIFLSLIPLLQVATGAFAWSAYFDDQTMMLASLVVLVGLLAFEAGQKLDWRWSPVLGSRPLLNRPLSAQIVFGMSSVSVLLAVILVGERGWETLVLSRSEQYQFLTSRYELPVMLLVTSLATTPIFVSTVALLVIWRFAKRRLAQCKLSWKWWIGLLIIAMLIFNNPLVASRMKIGTMLLSFIFLMRWRRWSNLLSIAILIVGLLVVFPYADIFRTTFDVIVEDKLTDTTLFNQLTEKGDFDAFQQIANTTLFVEDLGYQYGRQITGASLFWVPRALWEDKPLATGMLVAEHSGYPYTNLSLPLWGEFYIDGGLVLVGVGFFLYGVLVNILDSRHAAANQGALPTVASLLVPIFASYQIYFLRGSLMPAIAYFSPILLMALLASLAPRPSGVGFGPVSWTPLASGRRKPRCRDQDRGIRRSTGAR
jgi:hypothetical protein